jgi:preprotein translocase SecE subunit
MARNRQRAKDRKQRQPSANDAGRSDDGAVDAPVIDPELAGGAPPDDLGTVPPPIDFDDDAYDDGDDLDAHAGPVDEQLGAGAGDVAAPPPKKRSFIFQITSFLRACWAELQRVQWPDRRQVGQATAVVLGFVVIAGAFLGLADVVAQRLVDLIL